MVPDARNLACRTLLRIGRSARRSRNLFPVCALLIAGLFCVPEAWSAQVCTRSLHPAISGAQTAIADFDGDQRLDLASIETGGAGSASTDYWIQLQLTESGRQAIHLVAPSGGLLIEARDVNGDNAIDLVLSTAWFKQPVAVFLNDGHGKFSRAEPSEFPGAWCSFPGKWDSPSGQAPEAIAIPPQPRTGICAETTSLPEIARPTEPVRSFRSAFLFDSLLIAYAGRAPPAEIPHL
jgi:hypothetical protein